jgi:hypothetical protein
LTQEINRLLDEKEIRINHARRDNPPKDSN